MVKIQVFFKAIDCLSQQDFASTTDNNDAIEIVVFGQSGNGSKRRSLTALNVTNNQSRVRSTFYSFR